MRSKVYEKGFWKNKEVMHPGGMNITEDILNESGLKGGRILDIGCGKGSTLALLIEKGFKVYGIDYSEKFIEDNKKVFGEGNFVKVDLNKVDRLPFKDGYFHGVISECVINILEDKQLIMREICRVLKKDGIFLLNDLKTFKMDSTKRIWSEEGWLELIEDSGLGIISIKDRKKELDRFILESIWNEESCKLDICVPEGYNMKNLSYFSCIARKNGG